MADFLGDALRKKAQDQLDTTAEKDAKYMIEHLHIPHVYGNGYVEYRIALKDMPYSQLSHEIRRDLLSNRFPSCQFRIGTLFSGMDDESTTYLFIRTSTEAKPSSV